MFVGLDLCIHDYEPVCILFLVTNAGDDVTMLSEYYYNAKRELKHCLFTSDISDIATKECSFSSYETLISASNFTLQARYLPFPA